MKKFYVGLSADILHEDHINILKKAKLIDNLNQKNLIDIIIKKK